MKYPIIIILLLFIPSAAISQITLTIEITSLENNNGKVQLKLMDEEEKMIGSYSNIIVENRCVIIIEDLAPGKYGFKYFHDEDKNKELDTNWIGIPDEGFGFSNNAEGTFGPPDFVETIFELNEDMTVKCEAKYL